MARDDKRRGGRRDGRRDRQRGDGESDLFDKLVSINRVAKVVKGGRRFGFAALVVVGDRRGRVGFGAGKAREVPEAIRKATEQAKRGLIRVPLRDGRTLHHDVQGRYGAGRVVLRAAPAGTGVIAGGPMRAVFETLGVQDVVTKSIGTSNPHNMVRATFAALQRIQSPRAVAASAAKKWANSSGGAPAARMPRRRARPNRGSGGSDGRKDRDRNPDRQPHRAPQGSEANARWPRSRQDAPNGDP